MPPENNPQTTPAISKKLLFLNGALVFLVIVMFFIIANDVRKPKNTKVVAEKPATTPTAFNNVSLNAKAAYVYDVSQHRVIYSKNENTQLPLASLTKLMMALTAIELVPTDSHITIRKEFLQEDGDNGLIVGESWTLKNLLDFSLVVSSNDGARSVASVIGAYNLHTQDLDLGRKDFIVKMNEQAKTLGLTGMYFINEDGLDEGDTSGGYGSAKNVGDLLTYILAHKPDLLEATVDPTTTVSSSVKTHVAQNTDTITEKIPGLLASKTGYTALAGGNLAVAFDAGLNEPIVVVVLGSTQDGRFTDVEKLVKASQQYVKE